MYSLTLSHFHADALDDVETQLFLKIIEFQTI